MTGESGGTQSPEQVVAGLLEGSFDGIDERIIDAIRRLGAEAVAPLLTMAQNEDLGGREAPGGGSAPVRAMELLAEMRAEEAMMPLLDLLPTLPELSIIRDRVADWLPRYGRALLEPLLERTMQPKEAGPLPARRCLTSRVAHVMVAIVTKAQRATTCQRIALLVPGATVMPIAVLRGMGWRPTG